MPEFLLDGKVVSVPDEITLAAALAMVADGTCRTATSGERRAPFCGMGICQECRVMIENRRRLACQTICVEGMQVWTR
ncbi:hypothetical protein D3C85_1103190 [compost metagenome]